MDLNIFRTRVEQTFGPELERATAETIRTFVRELEAERRGESPPPARYHLEDAPPESIEHILRSFFSHVLGMPAEEAIIALWLMAADMAFADAAD